MSDGSKGEGKVYEPLTWHQMRLMSSVDWDNHNNGQVNELNRLSTALNAAEAQRDAAVEHIKVLDGALAHLKYQPESPLRSMIAAFLSALPKEPT